MKNILKRIAGIALFGIVFSLSALAQVPANDEPCNAQVLTPATTCTYQQFTNLNATGSAVPDPLCANYLGGDVWFQAVVPPGGALNFDTEAGVMLDGGMAVYSGTCNNLTLLDCDDDGGTNLMPYLSLGGLTPGSTVWIRVWEYGGNNNGTFGICVTIPPPAPANDEPCNAISIPVQATCTYQTFTNESALGSAGVPDPGCADYQGGDVWFTVTVPPSGSLLVDMQTGAMTDAGMALYSGSCNNLTLIQCDDNGSANGFMSQILASNLTPGATLWVRVWSYSNSDNGTFGICASIPPPGPANDDPCNAITLTPSNSCTYATYSNQFASPTTGVPPPGCASYQGGDVWFKVTVPCGGALTFDMQEGQMTDAGMALYSGTCNNLTLIECDDDDSPNGLMSSITRSDFTPGSTIWVRIWEYANDNNGSFGICVTVPPPPGPGGSCQTANSFCTGTTYVFPNNTNVPSLGGGGIYDCLSTTPNPVWYYMQIQNPGNISITINQISATGTPLDVDFAVWGPFPSLSATCSGISATNVVDCSYSSAATETADIPNAQAGQFYMMLITNFSNQSGVITFQQTGGTASTNCAVICTIGAASTSPACAGSTIDLSSTTVTGGGTYSWTGPDCFTSTSQNPTGVTPPSQPGDYTYTVTAVSSTGSTCYASTVVTVSPSPGLGADSTRSVCTPTTVNLNDIYNTTGLTASWTQNGNPVANPTAITTPGAYQLIAVNTQGCKDTAVYTLNLSQVSGIVSATDGNCTTTGEITVSNPSGTSPFTYSISSNPSVFQSSPTFSVPAGNYTVTIKDAGNCTYIGTPVVVAFNDNLSLQSSRDTSICSGNSVNITTNSNATDYSWSPASGLSDATSANPVATPTATTRYIVTATLGTCTKKDTVNISIKQSVSVDAGPAQSIFSGGNATLQATATGASTYTWSPSAGLSATNVLNPVASPTQTTLYTLTASNSEGCVDSDTVRVIVIPYCVHVKNAFSPNGDGVNEVWTVYDDYACLQNVTVHVYNRYGNKVFESRDYRNNWNGRYNGKPVPDGTYYAVIEFKLISGRTFTQKTDLTIIR